MSGPREAPAALRITVRCFSHVRDALGSATLTLELPAGATVSLVEARVRGLAPGKLEHLPWRIALNQCFIEDDAALADGDEVALIPPVQGG